MRGACPRLLIGLLVFVGSSSVAANLQAAPILWTIDAGSNLSGSFTYDADTNTYSNIAITTTVPNASFDTNDILPGFAANGFELITNFGAADLTNEAYLTLGFGPLTNAGGTFTINPGFVAVCLNAACQTLNVDRATGNFTGRTVSSPSVPEPMTLLLVGSGVLGVGVRRWRQRRT